MDNTADNPGQVLRAPTANEIQIGGNHYRKYGDLQPWDLWEIWNLNPFQASILKHVVRYRDKLGIQDLQKARHYLDKLIEIERGKLPKDAPPPGVQVTQPPPDGLDREKYYRR